MKRWFNQMVNIGDIVFQLLALGVPIFFIAIIIVCWRSFKKKREQLARIEEKLDSLMKKD